jgi:hypothetical protein
MLLASVHGPPPEPRCGAVRVQVEDGEWVEWAAQVPRLDMETHRVTASDVVVPTTDTLRHVEVRQGLPVGSDRGRKPRGSFVPSMKTCNPPGRLVMQRSI